MVLKAEVIEGKAYILLEDGSVWRVRDDDMIVIEKLDTVSRDQLGRLCEPRLQQFVGIA